MHKNKKIVIVLIVIALVVPTLMFSGSRYFLNRGVGLMDESPERARTYLKISSILNPLSGEAYIYRARTFYDEDELVYYLPYVTLPEVPEEAIRDYRKAISRNFNNYEAYRDLGRFYFSKAVYYGTFTYEDDKARKYTEKTEKYLVKANKEEVYPHDYYRIGYAILSTHEDSDLAIKYFQKLIEKEPNNALAHAGIGQAYNLKERYGKAISYFEESLELNPNPLAYRGMAEAYYKLTENPRVAITYYRKSRALDWPLYECYYNLSLMYAELNDRDSAEHYLNRLRDVGAYSVFESKINNSPSLIELNLN